MKVKIQYYKPPGYKTININRRKAIRERCLNCSSWYTKETINCNFLDCSLYPFRLGTGKQNSKERNKAIRDYCLWCSGEGTTSEVRKCTNPDCALFAYRLSGTDKSIEIKD